jgi:hypothetical protein
VAARLCRLSPTIVCRHVWVFTAGGQCHYRWACLPLPRLTGRPAPCWPVDGLAACREEMPGLRSHRGTRQSPGTGPVPAPVMRVFVRRELARLSGPPEKRKEMTSQTFLDLSRWQFVTTSPELRKTSPDDGHGAGAAGTVSPCSEVITHRPAKAGQMLAERNGTRPTHTSAAVTPRRGQIPAGRNPAVRAVTGGHVSRCRWLVRCRGGGRR